MQLDGVGSVYTTFRIKNDPMYFSVFKKWVIFNPINQYIKTKKK